LRKLPLTAKQQQQREDKTVVNDRLNSVEKRVAVLEAEAKLRRIK
jgi:hypothetical protein